MFEPTKNSEGKMELENKRICVNCIYHRTQEKMVQETEHFMRNVVIEHFCNNKNVMFNINDSNFFTGVPDFQDNQEYLEYLVTGKSVDKLCIEGRKGVCGEKGKYFEPKDKLQSINDAY